MTDDDAELLRRYTAEESEEAFAELVRRHIDFVYGAAMRQARGNAALAQDVTQAVFSDLARKAGGLARHEVIVGWLHTATRFATAKAMRTESRRNAREQEAFAMDEILRESETPVDWEKLHPVLDEVLGELKERERAAILLRFFEKKPLAEIGAKLALSETAARSCVDRALEKMRALLVRRGVTSTTAALALAFANQMAIAAPAGLAASVTGAALAGASGGGAGALLAFLTMSKIKIGIVSAIIVVIGATGFVELRGNRELRAELRALRGGGDDPVRLRRENQTLNTALATLGEKNPEADELARLRNRATQLKSRPPGVVDSEFKPASSWRNVGRATPEAATETFHWALAARDLDAAAGFVVFRDDTKENREAFMAHFSEAVRAKYQTPERLVAAAVFGAGQTAWGPDVAYQVIGSDDHVGGDGTRFGQINVRIWYRTATGEREGGGRWQSTPDGWATGALNLVPGSRRSDDALGAVLSLIDPATGERLPVKK